MNEEYVKIGNTIYELGSDGVTYRPLDKPSKAIIKRCAKTKEKSNAS